MDYKNKEALEIVKQMVTDGQLAQDVAERYFPELKESEDDRIRKNLIDYLKEFVPFDDTGTYIAWLERQGELKPQIKLVFPKFRVGDVIQHVPLEKWDTTKKITHIDETGYYFDYSHQGDTISGGFIGFSFENDYELVEQKPVEEVNGEDYGIDSLYAAMDILNKTLGQVEGYQSDDGILEHKAAITAIKKLYKQKSVEWSEEDERNMSDLIESLSHANPWEYLSNKGYHKTTLVPFLKSLRPQST